MNYNLPTSLEIHGREYKIRSDYRDVLTIMEAMNDPDLTERERGAVILDIFFPEFEEMPEDHYQQAIEKCLWFINGGEPERSNARAPRLVDWEQDFPRIIAPVNRVLGLEARSVPYLHWWSFLCAYMEIGDCLFAQVVNVRSKKAKGKKLDKAEQDFYRNNRQIIDFKKKLTNTEEDILSEWIGKKN